MQSGWVCATGSSKAHAVGVSPAVTAHFSLTICEVRIDLFELFGHRSNSLQQRQGPNVACQACVEGQRGGNREGQKCCRSNERGVGSATKAVCCDARSPCQQPSAGQLAFYARDVLWKLCKPYCPSRCRLLLSTVNCFKGKPESLRYVSGCVCSPVRRCVWQMRPLLVSPASRSCRCDPSNT